MMISCRQVSLLQRSEKERFKLANWFHEQIEVQLSKRVKNNGGARVKTNFRESINPFMTVLKDQHRQQSIAGYLRMTDGQDITLM